jgi:hypothetical protein
VGFVWYYPLLGAVVVIFAFMAFAAFAQPAPGCVERAIVVQRMAETYGEVLVNQGINQRGLVEVFASPKTGTWTIIITKPDGVSCFLTAGELWEDVETKPGDPA